MEPTPTPMPLPDPFDFLPTPFPIPAPGSGPVDTSPLWDWDNIEMAISAYRTIFELAKQNNIMLIIWAITAVLVAIVLIANSSVGRDDKDV